ncbi:MAG: hypothetical protein WBC18_17395 [Ottowia sp.]|uniref:hypothetical protein n=1 Tax=Ottowia sp. TaxID=1898956 RepID=UPI003C775E18
MAADNISAVFGSYGGGWSSTSGVIADGSNDLLSFTVLGTTYSTGVNDALVPGSFTPASFRAFNPDPSQVPAVGGLNAVPLSGTYNPAKTRASYLSDGNHGLDLNTALFNIPKTELRYFATVANASAIADTVPDVLVTQVGQPSNQTFDEFYFTDSSGQMVGNAVQIIFGSGAGNAVPAIGKQNWQFWNPNHTAQSNLNGNRDLRMRAYHLSDFGITALNMGQITRFVQKMSGESDVSFVAYNEEAVTVPASLVVNKTNGFTQLEAAKTGVAYTVTLTNVGGSMATGVSWQDAPLGLAITSITSLTSPDGPENAGLCTLTGCNSISISPGSTFSYHVTANVTGAAGTIARNTATVNGGGCNAGTATQPTAVCTSTDEDPIVTPPASVTVHKTNHLDEVTQGSSILYTVVLTNNGESGASNLQWTDTPEGLTITAITPTSAVMPPGAAGICSLTGCSGIILPTGSSASYAVTATVTAAAGATAANTAIVNGGGCLNGTPDSDSPNAVCTSVDQDPVIPQVVLVPALKIIKTNTINVVKPGDTVTYTVTIENTGTGPATNVSWTDTPENLNVTSIVSENVGNGSQAGTCTTTGCTGIAVAQVDGVVSYTVTATINANATGSITNTATLSGDCTGDDCSSSDTDTITPGAAPTPVPATSNAALMLLGMLLMAAVWRIKRVRKG